MLYLGSTLTNTGIPMQSQPNTKEPAHGVHGRLISPIDRNMRIQLHPYLKSSLRDPKIYWNLRDHPSLASRRQHSLSSAALHEPATEPALSSLTIYLQAPLPASWKITVVPSTFKGTYVTLKDALQAIYTQLRINLGPKDFARLSSRSEQKEAVSAYGRRYTRHKSQEMYDQEKNGGMKRVDFLGRNATFLGLEGTKRADVWILNTGDWMRSGRTVKFE